MSADRIRDMLAQVTIGCNDEQDEFDAVLTALSDNIRFPLKAEALGETVDIIGLDPHRSSLRKGILARYTKHHRELRIPLSELTFVDPDPVSAEWLGMHSHWAGRHA